MKFLTLNLTILKKNEKMAAYHASLYHGELLVKRNISYTRITYLD